MPKGRKKGNRRTGGKSGSQDRFFANSHRATGSTTTMVNADYTRRVPSFNIVQTPPRNLSNQIYWAQFSADNQLTVSSLVVSENNIAFTLGMFDSTLVKGFDQYCIYSVTASWFYCLEPTGVIVRIYTALDYDSVAAIGKVALQAYSTYEAAMLSGNTSLIRYVKPCIAPTVSNTTPLDQSALVTRQWIDSAYPSIPHYGIRCILDLVGTTQVSAVEVSYTAIIGYRNNI